MKDCQTKQMFNILDRQTWRVFDHVWIYETKNVAQNYH